VAVVVARVLQEALAVEVQVELVVVEQVVLPTTTQIAELHLQRELQAQVEVVVAQIGVLLALALLAVQVL
jgi:hypothetical protein